MSAVPPILMQQADYFLVSHGKTGALGSFLVQEPLPLARGDRVVLRTCRGLELGTIRGPATVRQSRLLGEQAGGVIVRRLGPDDAALLEILRRREHDLFAESRRLAQELSLPVDVVDVDVLLDDQAILQVVFAADPPLTAWLTALGDRFGVKLLVENLAQAPAVHDEQHAGCGKPDCGKTEGGGCSTCSTGGGCSSCGSGGQGVDMKQYFGHLREKMESNGRHALL